MNVVIHFDQLSTQFAFTPSPHADDVLDKFAGGKVFFDLPSGKSLSATHPDLLALVVILTMHPFVGKLLSINVAVSEEFKSTCGKLLPYNCEFLPTVDGASISPRAKGSTPGLSFSGGVDSTAALAIMPPSTMLFFLDRVQSTGEEPKGLYNKDSARVACSMVSELGYQVHAVRTNLEYIRSPVGFPVDWASGAPAVLLADIFDLSSVSWGVVAESAYRVGHENYISFPRRTIFSRWDGLLRAVGLALGAPVAGISEVGTSLIAMRSPLRGVAQSCIRGSKGEECMNCFKCFRKTLLEAALIGKPYPGRMFERVVRFRGGRDIVLGLPIKHENVFRWTAGRIRVDGEAPTWDAFRERLEVGSLSRDVSWAHAWYQPSSVLIPSEFRDEAIDVIRRYLPDQSEGEERAFEAWDLRSELASEGMGIAMRRLESALLDPKSAI